MKISRLQFAIFGLGFMLVILACLYFVRTIFHENLSADEISQFISPFLPLLNDFQVVPQHNLLSCNIRKAMSQLSYNIMCFLNNPVEFERNNQSFSDTWKQKRKSCPQLSKVDQGELILGSPNLTRFAFVRDPMERFVSFFVDKCLRNNACWDCKDDIRCVVRNIYFRLQKNVHNSNHIKSDYETWIDWHVAPQTWNCNFNKHFHDFHLIHIGPSARDRAKAIQKLQNVLDIAGVSKQHIQKLVEGVKTEDTEHATYFSKERRTVLMRIHKDHHVKDYLWKIYYHDYVAFGFRGNMRR